MRAAGARSALPRPAAVRARKPSRRLGAASACRAQRPARMAAPNPGAPPCLTRRQGFSGRHRHRRPAHHPHGHRQHQRPAAAHPRSLGGHPGGGGPGSGCSGWGARHRERGDPLTTGGSRPVCNVRHSCARARCVLALLLDQNFELKHGLGSTSVRWPAELPFIFIHSIAHSYCVTLISSPFVPMPPWNQHWQALAGRSRLFAGSSLTVWQGSHVRL